MGAEFATRWRRTKESVLAMKSLWTHGEAEYNGEFVRFPAVKSYPQPVQRPHPPVLLGAHGDLALKRVVSWCEGWFPFQLSPDELGQGMAKLRQYASEAGKNPDAIDVSLSWFGDTSDVDTIKRYEDTGLQRLVCALPVTDANEFEAALETLAERTLAKIG